MKFLYANDDAGQHAPSWYANEGLSEIRPRLAQHTQADVCIVGAGYTGLSAAIELGKQGHSVIVLEAHRVGWGASGRNGGQLGTGFNRSQIELEKTVGALQAHALWDIAEGSKQWILSICNEYALDIEQQPGIVQALHRKRYVKGMHEYCNYLKNRYGYVELEPLDAVDLRKRVDSQAYVGGAVDHGASHVHCLKLARGLATAAEQLEVRIFEMSEAVRLDRRNSQSDIRVITASGSVTCDRLIIATNGYLDRLYPPLQKHLMPINNFIVVTEPLGSRATSLLPFNDAVADSRFVVNYFRRVENDRLLFGGGENYSYRFPSPIGPSVRRAMLGIFPQLQDVKIEYAWGGTLAITRNRLPCVLEPEPGVYFAAGYSGHGVALACGCGVAIAKQINGDPDGFATLSNVPMHTFPGGEKSRPLLLAAAMSFYSWMDRL